MTKPLNRRRLGALALAATAISLPLPSMAQVPDRTTIVVPYPPGSAPDVLARIVATKVGLKLNKSVIVENRAGANAIIGSDFVAKAKGDGATYLLVDRMTAVVNPLLYRKLPYDPAALKSVTDVASVDLMLSVKRDAPVKNWAEFLSYAKANPGTAAIGTGGLGSVHHLSLELLSKATGTNFTHVPYKGVTPAVQDVLSGQLFGVISGPEVVLPHVGGGRLRVLATGAAQRSPLFPEVPTLKELGLNSAVLLPTTFTLFAPPNTPDAVLTPFGDAVRAVLAEPDTAERLAQTGLIPAGSTPKAIQAALAKLGPQLSAVIRDANIRLD